MQLQIANLQEEFKTKIIQYITLKAGTNVQLSYKIVVTKN